MKIAILNSFAGYRAARVASGHLLGILLLTATAGPLAAQTLQWDANGTGAAVTDGGGTWDTTNSNWWNGTANTSWNNAGGTIAVFGNGGVAGTSPAAATINVAGTVQAAGLQFESIDLTATENRSYQFSGGTISLADGAFIRMANSTSNVGNARVTFNSALAGNNITFEKNGTDLGLVTMTGANTWTGTLTLANVAGAGGTFLNVTNLASLTSLAKINVQTNNTLVINYTQTGAMNVPIEIAGTGNGNRGAIRFDQNRTLSGPVTLLANSSISANGVASPPTGTLAGAIGESGGSRSLNINTNGSAGTIVLAGANTFTGGVTISAGTLGFGHAGALNTASPNLLTFANNTNAKTVTLNGFSIATAGLSSLSATDSVVIQNASATAASLTLANTTDVSFRGVIADGAGGGALTLIKTGTGTQSLTGTASTYTGGTVLNAGILRISGDQSLGAVPATLDSDNITFNGGILQFAYSGTSASPSLSSNRGILLQSGGGTLDTSTGTTYYAGPISGSGALNKTGTGKLVLAGASTYTGETVLSQGTLEIRHAQALGSADGRTRAVSGTRVELAGGVTVSGELLITPLLASTEGSNTWAGGIQAAELSTLTFETAAGSQLLISGNVNGTDIAGSGHSIILQGSDSGTISGNISNSLSITKSGTGTWTLSGNNTFTSGVNLTQGRLILGSAGALNASSPNAVNFASNANSKLLSLVGTSSAVGGLNAAVSTGVVTENGGAADATLTIQTATGQSYAYAGVLADGTGGGKLAVNKTGPGTQSLSGTNNYTGNTTVGGGTLQLNFAAAGAPASNIINSASALIMNGGTLSLAGGSSAANSQTFNGTTVTSGNSTISLVRNATTPQDLVLDLGAITQQNGGTINFVLPSGTQSVANGIRTTSANDASGILGGWATVNGTDWASVSGGNIVAFTGYQQITNFSSGAGAVGPLPNNGNAHVKIVDGGTSGNIAPAVTGGTTNISTLIQSAAGVAVIGTANGDTLRLGVSGGIMLTSGAGNLTIGAAANNGSVLTAGGTTAGTAGQLLFSDQTASQTITVNSIIRDNGAGGTVSVTKNGPGTLVLAGTTSDYSGGTFINGGIVRISADRSLGAVPASAQAGNITFNGGTLQWGASLTLSSNRGITLQAGGGTLDVQAQTTTYGGSISGAGALTKLGTGTLTLSGSNSYTGETLVNAGTLAVNHNQALGSALGTTTVASGAGLRLENGVTVTGETVTINGNGNGNNGALQVNTNANATWNGNVILGSNLARIGGLANSLLVVNGVIQNGSAATNSLAISTAGAGGVVQLGGINTYTGSTQIIRGTLRLGISNSLPSTTALTVYTANTVTETTMFDLNGFDQTLGGLTSVVPNSANDVVSVHNSNNASTSTLTVNQSTNSTFNGKITGNLALVKDGSGTLTLTNTYNSAAPTANVSNFTGKTTIRAGTLALSGTGNLTGTPWIQVDQGATFSISGRTGGSYALTSQVLSGQGTVNGLLNVGGTSYLSPGDSTGTLANAGNGTGELTFNNLTLAGGSPSLRALFQLGGTINNLNNPLAAGDPVYFANAGSGGLYDSIQVNGTLGLNAGSTLKVELVSGYIPQLGDVFNLLDWVTALNLDADGAGGAGSFTLADLDLSAANAAIAGNGWYFETNQFLSHGVIYVVVPEPSRVLFVTFGLMALFFRRRR